MKGPSWYDKSKQTPEQRKLEIMRRAKTEAENSYSINGRLKEGTFLPKPITLPKMPWDD